MSTNTRLQRYNRFLFENADFLATHTRRKHLTQRFKRFLWNYFGIRPALAPVDKQILEQIRDTAVHEADRTFASAMLANWFPR